MKIWPLYLTLFGFYIPLNADCAWQTNLEPLRFAQNGDVDYLIIDEPTNPEFWQPTKSIKIIQKYQKSVIAKIDPDPFVLLRRQRAIYAAAKFEDHLAKFDKVINGTVGTIRDAHCIELLLFAEHAKRFAGTFFSTEFNALILKNETSKRTKIYYGSESVKSGEGPSLSNFNEEIRQDIRNGYTMMYSLHNHPFMFDNQTGDIAGTTIPSDPDIRFYIKMKNKFALENAIITNGISTIEISSSEFEKLAH